MERLDEIRERWEKATQGPWTATFEEGDNWWSITGAPHEKDGDFFVNPEVATVESGGDEDADAIAQARDDAPALTAAVQAVLDLHDGWAHDAPDPLVLLLVKRTREAITAALEGTP